MKTIKIKKKEFKKLYDIACVNWKPKLEDKLKPFLFSEDVEFEQGFVDEMEKACTKEQKVIFEKIFAKFLNTNSDLFKIKTYSELCKKYKIKKLKISDFKFLPIEQREKALAYHQIRTIEKIYNGDWVIDWKNHSQYKYFPWFEYKFGQGLVYDCSLYRYSCSDGPVAYFKDEKTSIFIGKVFINIYKILISSK